MLITFIISTIVLAIAVGFLFTKNTFFKSEITHIKSLLELAEAERDLQKYLNESLKKSKTETSKPASTSKKKYYRKPKAKKTEE